MTYSNEELLRMYKDMVLARMYEEIAMEYLTQGALKFGSWHLALGEEATQTGSLSALKEGDFYAPTHRCHGALAQKLDLKKFTAESVCKATGYQRGKAATVHIGDLDSGVLNVNGILGAGAPIAVGFATGLKKQGKKGAVLYVIGDGASNEGNFAEAVNLAGAWGAPIVFFIENNGMGMTVATDVATRCHDLSQKGAAAGLPGVTVDGTDVVAVREAVDLALEKARNGQPSIVEAKCCRYESHSVGVPDVGRDPSVVAEAKKNDPVEKHEKLLRSLGSLNDDLKTEMYEDTRKRCVEAFEYAIASPDQTPEMVLDLNLVYGAVLDNLN